MGQDSTSQQSLENSANLNIFDFSGDFNFLSTFEDSLFGFTNPDQESEMSSSAQHTRKCSISDIISVINEEQNLLKNSKFLKDEGYLSTHFSDSNNQSFNSISTSSENNDLDDSKESGSENITIDEISELYSPNDNAIDMSCGTGMLQTDPTNIWILIKHNNKTKLLNTTNKKLQIILGKIQHTLNTESTLTVQSNDQEEGRLNETNGKKRGRKRIYFSNTDSEREYSKRLRNNEACKKFRQSRTSKIKSLFELESTLLEKNLNLKEQVASLQRQLVYIKGKLDISSG